MQLVHFCKTMGLLALELLPSHRYLNAFFFCVVSLMIRNMSIQCHGTEIAECNDILLPDYTSPIKSRWWRESGLRLKSMVIVFIL